MWSLAIVPPPAQVATKAYLRGGKDGFDCLKSSPILMDGETAPRLATLVQVGRGLGGLVGGCMGWQGPGAAAIQGQTAQAIHGARRFGSALALPGVGPVYACRAAKPLPVLPNSCPRPARDCHAAPAEELPPCS